MLLPWTLRWYIINILFLHIHLLVYVNVTSKVIYNKTKFYWSCVTAALFSLWCEIVNNNITQKEKKLMQKKTLKWHIHKINLWLLCFYHNFKVTYINIFLYTFPSGGLRWHTLKVICHKTKFLWSCVTL